MKNTDFTRGDRSKLIYNKISVITGDVTDDYLIKLTAL